MLLEDLNNFIKKSNEENHQKLKTTINHLKLIDKEMDDVF